MLAGEAGVAGGEPSDPGELPAWSFPLLLLPSQPPSVKCPEAKASEGMSLAPSVTALSGRHSQAVLDEIT